MMKPRTAVLLSAAVLGCVFVAGCGKSEPAILCYVGGTMRPAMEEIRALYEKETGRKVEIDYADSGQCLIKIEQTRLGDCYVSHDPFPGAALKKGLAKDLFTVATLKPTIAVAKGNPKGITGLADLAKPGIKLGLTDATHSTLGHICPILFKKAGVEAEIEKNVVMRSREGGQVANAVVIGNLDAAIVWDAVIFARRDKLDAVVIAPELLPQPGVDAVTTATYGTIDMGAVRVAIETLTCSKRPEEAKAFAEFANSPRGRQIFRKNGFSPAPAAKPESSAPESFAGKTLTLYCAAGLQPAMKPLVEAFEAETGAKVECDYGGSGVLLSRLKLVKEGDLYLPAEQDYVDLAKKDGLVESEKAVCEVYPVILVRKGNPKRIRTLADLARPGIKLGLGNPQACQIGRASEQLFAKNGVDAEAIRKNVVFQSVTVNELGLQIKTGSLDATIVWDAIAALYPDDAEAVAIPREKNVSSHFVIALLKSAKDKPLAEKFMDFLVSPKAREIFRKQGYSVPERG